MATGSRKDVELRLRVNTEGASDVKGLAGDFHDLAREGAGVETAFDGAAGGLAAISAQTQTFRAAEAAAKADTVATSRAIAQQSDELQRLKINYKATGGDAATYKSEVQRLSLAIVDSKAKLREKQDALTAASASAKAAAVAERNLAAEIERTAKTTTKAATDTRTGLESVHKSGLDAAGTLRLLGPLLAAAFSGQQFVQAIATNETLTRSFEQIFGSAGRAREELDFIKATANRLGLENQTLAKSYQSLAAATKGTTSEGQQTRDVFEAVARAMSSLGKSTPETERALTAIAQIASKGTVSMEELRGQLGEALPGALQAAAKGAGITTEQLIAMVSAGNVTARDMLPALTKGLNDLYASAAPPETIFSGWARFKNTLEETAVAIGEGGAAKGITKGLSGTALAVQGLSAAFDILGTGIGETAAALVTGNLQLSQGEALAIKYAEALRKSAETAGFADKAQAGLNAAQAKGATTAVEAFRITERLAESQSKAGDSMLKVQAFYTEAATGAEVYTKQLEKELAARREEGALLQQYATLAGSEIEQRQAATAATEMQANAARRLALAREVEAVIAQSLSIRLQEEALKRNDNTEATRKEIEAAQKVAAAKNTEAEQSKASAAAKRIEAEAAKASAAAYQDNSTRVYELRGAMVEANQALERLTALQKQGKATADQVSDATAKAAAATRVYRDALADASAAAQRQISTVQQLAQAAQAAISVDLARTSAAREVAAANGDIVRVGRLQRQETALQVRAYEEEADAARRVAQAIRDAAARKEEELKASRGLTTAKREEIEAQRRSADLKELEAQKTDILAQSVRDLANSERARTASLEAQITAEEKALDLAERRLKLDERKRNAYDTAGNVVNAEVPTAASVTRDLTERGLTPDAARSEAAKFFNPNGSLNYGPGNNLGGSTLSDTLSRVAQRNASGTAVSDKPQAGTSHTVTINLDGNSKRIATATSADADNLAGVLRQLGQASGNAA